MVAERGVGAVMTAPGFRDGLSCEGVCMAGTRIDRGSGRDEVGMRLSSAVRAY